MRVVAILQARMNSTRLPGKMLLPLCGKPLVQHVIERVMRATMIHETVLAFPVADTPAFSPMQTTGVSLFPYPGDEHDLVARYLSAALAHDADIIVRVPCDNPCVEPKYIDEAVASYLARPQVYSSTFYTHWKDRTYIDGLGAEVVSLSRLKWLDQATTHSPQYREHPHLLFQDQHLIAGYEQYVRHANASDTVRLDVNTPADYDFIKDIYEHCYPHNQQFGIVEILAYLHTKQVPV